MTDKQREKALQDLGISNYGVMSEISDTDEVKFRRILTKSIKKIRKRIRKDAKTNNEALLLHHFYMESLRSQVNTIFMMITLEEHP